MIIMSFKVGWIAKLLGFIRRHHRRSFQLLSRFYGTFIGIALGKFDPFTSLKAGGWWGPKKVKYAAQKNPRQSSKRGRNHEQRQPSHNATFNMS